ncbi:MAG: hypothetical protein EDM03_03095 [Porphyrobacter sp. IPPAS B-1204]|nr:MAG: hypothetical protein EDM03_03095 [Porphyrobacter sp. IPPAS B-1204]
MEQSFNPFPLIVGSALGGTATMQILVKTPKRLVITHKPKLAFVISAGLGLLAIAASLHDLLIAGAPANKDNLIGLIMGLVCLFGAVFLYRETTTTFDRTSGRVTWHQRGLTVGRSEVVQLEQIRDVVTVSHVNHGASRVCLILDHGTLPLMFGYHGLGGNERIRAAIRDFLQRQ